MSGKQVVQLAAVALFAVALVFLAVAAPIMSAA